MTDYASLAAQFGGQPIDVQGMDYSTLAKSLGGKPVEQTNPAAARPEFQLPFGLGSVTTPTNESGFNLPAAVIAAGRKLDDINQGIRDAKLSVMGTAYQMMGLDNAAQETANERGKISMARYSNEKPNAQLDAIHPGSTLIGSAAPLMPLNAPAQAVVAASEYGTPLERLTRAGVTYGAGKAVQGLGAKATSNYEASAADAAAQNAQNADLTATLQAAQARGFVVPPAMSNPTRTNQIIEGIGGKAGMQQQASNINDGVAQTIARQALGMPDNAPITTNAVRTIRKAAYAQGYAPVANAGQFPVSPEYNAALDSIASGTQDAAKSFPGVASNDVAGVVDSFRPPNGVFDAGHAIKAVETLRKEASDLWRSGNTEMYTVKRQLANEIENELERQLAASGQNGQQLLTQFRQARQRMAISHDVEDAIREGSGKVENSVFGRKYQAGDIPPDSPLAVAGAFANNFQKANQRPGIVGSANVSKLEGMTGALFGAAGHAVAGPYGMAAAAIPFVAPPLARSALLSQAGQRFMTIPQPAQAQGLLGSKALDNQMAPWIAGLLASQAASR